MREVVETDGCRIVDSVFKIPDTFLPNVPPLSLQQAFTLQQDVVLIQPKVLLCVCTHTVSTAPGGETSTCAAL